MSKIECVDEIESITVHWSESMLINRELGNDGDDIEKTVTASVLDVLIARSVKEIASGFDKLSLSITLKSGLQWCCCSKFYVGKSDLGLLTVINKGQ